ncbi:MAG: type II toxin-antitoxin system Phd/YefM family antitoxin [Bacteroidetes bacterium]|nr:type II toxin-antitoxin system Phd/YefM family antitoxin [Bacteroidota bacterium]
MKKNEPSEIIIPISKLRKDTSKCFREIKEMKLPAVITRNNKRVAVILDVDMYEDMIKRIETVTGFIKN